MAKFFGAVGYGVITETAPGVFKDTVVEHPYYGDIIRDSRRLREGEQVNDDITVQNSVSIVADPYATDNIQAMRYIRWQGTLWKVSDVEVKYPRLILRLGGVYNGPKDGTPVGPGDVDP